VQAQRLQAEMDAMTIDEKTKAEKARLLTEVCLHVLVCAVATRLLFFALFPSRALAHGIALILGHIATPSSDLAGTTLKAFRPMCLK